MNLNTLAMLQWPHSEQKDAQWQQLSSLLDQLSPEQKLWLSGFLAASANNTNTSSSAIQPVPGNQSAQKLTVLYGSQTGNGETIANTLYEQAVANGLAAELISMADLTVKQLVKKSHVALVVSTHGEGEAPDDAEFFYEQLFSSKAPKLDGITYSVLALGDSSYELYCQTGKDIDQQLEKLGARRLVERIDCDVDYQEAADQWSGDVLEQFTAELQTGNHEPSNITPLPISNEIQTTALATKQHPIDAEVLTIQKITGRGSGKNTFHLELEIEPDQIQYQPGDSLGIWAYNDPSAVDLLLQHWQLNGEEQHTFKGVTEDIKTLLTERIELTQISKPFIQFLAAQIAHKELNELATSHAAFIEYSQTKQLIDVLQEFDPEQTISIEQALEQLKGITPRLYSIASSQNNTEDEVHLTINLEDPTQQGLYGLASGALCRQTQVGDQVSVFVEPNKHFRLPENPDTPTIMIGPGTGVAPFRAFLQERQVQGAKGNNWLVFGNPHFSTDFLYQSEWLKLLKQGVLNQLDVAFSRDQEHKIYVQDKLQQQASLVWDNIQAGAHVYVCGDANRMAKDVENTLLSIISEHGAMQPEAAKDFLKDMKRNKRYQKDVY